MNRPMNRALCLAFLLLTAAAALAQNSAPSTPAAQSATQAAFPSDPGALLKLADQVNGLHGNQLQPWHIHATWVTRDGGKTVEHGTFEEWWAGEHKVKVAVTSSQGSRTTWDNGHGLFLLRTANLVAPQATRVQRLLVRPVIDSSALGGLHTQLQVVPEKKKGASLDCVRQNLLNDGGQPFFMIDPMGERRPTGVQYCFGDNLPAVRTRDDGEGRAAFNALVRYQGQFLARQIFFDYGIGPVTEVSVDTIEDLSPVVDADFNPPAEAIAIPDQTPVGVSGGVVAGSRISGSNPEYPSSAKMDHIQGTVILQATISVEGNITDLQVVTGPPALQQSALDAVKTWRYKPYLLGGKPVAVETQINVSYRLGR
jgi:TonB family protein